jgi:hypothetical protein
MGVGSAGGGSPGATIDALVFATSGRGSLIGRSLDIRVSLQVALRAPAVTNRCAREESPKPGTPLRVGIECIGLAGRHIANTTKQFAAHARHCLGFSDQMVMVDAAAASMSTLRNAERMSSDNSLRADREPWRDRHDELGRRNRHVDLALLPVDQQVGLLLR